MGCYQIIVRMLYSKKVKKTEKADADKIGLLREMPPALLVTVTRGAGGIMS